MSSILDSVRQQLDANTIQTISQQLGADPATTSNAISMALPALVGGLSRNASSPQGAAALDAALNDHDGSILDNLGGLLGGGGGTGAGSALGGLGGGIGGAILGHIFGAKRGSVEAGVGKASGLDAARTAQLLAMLAPIVMGVLGRMKRQKGIDANQLPDVLNAGRQQGEKEVPGLGGLLDANNDGQITDDLLRMGGTALGGLFGKK
ncbi:MAG TPA: DUF937 domain-containing protein [Thermoanaerobaculia bacterium]